MQIQCLNNKWLFCRLLEGSGSPYGWPRSRTLLRLLRRGSKRSSYRECCGTDSLWI